jgi:hypothetical protein
MSASLKEVLSQPIPVPVASAPDKKGGVVVKTVMVEPVVLLRMAAELLYLLSGEEREKSKIIRV